MWKLGCSQENWLNILTIHKCIDISMEMLKQGYINIHNRNLNNIPLLGLMFNELPFPNSIFYGVSCIGAMQLFTDMDQAIAEINRVVMDGGSMAAVTCINRGKWMDNDYQNYLKKLDLIRLPVFGILIYETMALGTFS